MFETRVDVKKLRFSGSFAASKIYESSYIFLCRFERCFAFSNGYEIVHISPFSIENFVSPLVYDRSSGEGRSSPEILCETQRDATRQWR